MREIKFRAWNKTTKRMHHFDIKSMASSSLYFPGYWHCVDSDCEAYIDQADISELMQYTGLKDKNGKEIYEGDIANSEFGIGTVEYGEITKAPEFHFDTGHDDLWLWCCKDSTLEVIGNIYENPELTAGNKEEK